MWFTMFKLTILNGPQVDLGQMLAAKDARVVKERALLVAALIESHPHDVQITNEAPNYSAH